MRAHLDAYGVAYTVEPTLVRGLDYYTRTVFEFIGPDESTQASTICAGGRYDYLVEEIGGPPTPGIGFGAGIERLVLSLELEGIARRAAAARRLRRRRAGAERARPSCKSCARPGSPPTLDYAGRSLKGQLGYGQKHARATLVLGAGGWTLRRGGELDVTVRDVEHLKELL